MESQGRLVWLDLIRGISALAVCAGLVPALLLTLITDRVISLSAPDVLVGSYFSTWASGPISADDYSASFITFIGNILFLQTILVPVFGSNSPLWSLANEFWYYISFPLVMFLFPFGGIDCSRRSKIVSALILLALVLWLPPQIIGGFLFWCMGAAVHQIAPKMNGRLRRISLVAGLTAFPASLLLVKTANFVNVENFWSDLIVALSFTFLCLGVVEAKVPALLNRLAFILSEISYSLYLIHFPLVVFIAGVIYGGAQFAPDMFSLLVYVGWLGALMMVSGGFWWMFERHTDRVRRAVWGAIS